MRGFIEDWPSSQGVIAAGHTVRFITGLMSTLYVWEKQLKYADRHGFQIFIEHLNVDARKWVLEKYWKREAVTCNTELTKDLRRINMMMEFYSFPCTIMSIILSWLMGCFMCRTSVCSNGRHFGLWSRRGTVFWAYRLVRLMTTRTEHSQTLSTFTS